MVGELAARHALSKEVVEGVSERTGGVPLFVEEVTRLLLERGEGGGAHLIPPTLQQSLAARLDRLGEAREVAQIGAVLGRSFSYALLRDVASASAVAEAGLLSALDKLADADLLLAEGAGHEANYRFKHALIQDAAYDSLLKSRRQALHRRAAEILRDSLERAAAEPEVIAHHFTEAGLDDLAIEWWGRAGDQALRRSAFQEAIAHLGKAIAMADKAGAASTPPALRREQIKLQVALITPLIHVKGYAAPETKAAAERALLLIEQAEALGEPPEDPLLLFSVLFAVWSASYVSFNGDAMRQLSAQFLALAEKQGTTVPLMIGHRIVGISLTCTGDLAEGRTHLDRAIALYDPTEHRPLATRFGVDARMAVLSYRSRALWLLGYPDAALTDSDQALSDARAVGQAATLMYALGHAPLTFFQCANYATANEIFDELPALADEKGALLWKALGMMNQGWLFALMSKASEAVHMITSGISALRSTGATLWVPLLLSYLARSHAELGQFDDAWRCISEATIAVETRKERWCEAEVSRVTGEIALMSPAPDAAKAETYFEHALSIARDQRAKSWELRAAMSMARLWRDQGKRQQAHDLLASVYGWFTEGFETLDLKEAKALLEQLRARPVGRKNMLGRVYR
jgi:predicted ATPase